MARIKLGSIVSDISGKVGGLCFQRNAYGISLKTNPTSVSKHYEQSFDVRSAMQYIQYLWRYMNDEQKNSYDRFSTFKPIYANRNKSSLLSGYNLFLKHGLLMLAAGQDPISHIQFVSSPVNLITPIIVRSGSQLYYNIGVNLVTEPFYVLSKFSSPRIRNSFVSKSMVRVVKAGYWAGSNIYFEIDYLKKWFVLPNVSDYLQCEFTVLSSISPVVYPGFSGMVRVTAP